MMRTGVTAIIFCLAFCPTTRAQPVEEPADRPWPKSQLQVLQALEIAQEAATNEMQQLSLRAVSMAFAGGPPTVALAKPTGTPTGSSIAFGTGLPKKRPDAIKANDAIREGLQQLDASWKARDFEPKKVFEALSNIVLPPGRPEEVFFYEQTMSATVLKTAGQLQPFSTGHLLVDWAERAGMQKELNQRLEKIKAFESGQLAATVLQCMIALKANELPVAKERLAELRGLLLKNSTGRDAEVAAQLVFPLLGSKDVSAEAASVAELVLDQIVTGASTSKNYHVEPATSILKLIAETYRKSGNKDKVRESVKRLIAANTAFNRRYSGSTNNYVQRLRQAQANTAAWIYLNAGMAADAAPFLAEYYELQSVTGRSFGFDAGAKLFRVLMAMTPEQRYEILSHVTFSGNNTVNLTTAFVPRSIPLPIFEQAQGTAGSPTKFELPAIGPMADVLNSASLLASTAREVGQFQHLQQKLADSSGPSSANIEMLQFFMQVESNDRDAELLKALIDNRADSLQSLKTDTNALKVHLGTLQDYSMAVAGLEIPETRQSAVKLLQSIGDSSRQVQNAVLGAHVQQSLNFAKLSDANVPSDSFTTPNLKHWRSANCDTDKTHAAGSVATTWATKNGYVKALTAPQDGLLFFRYPLTGDFEVSAMISHGFWQEGGFVYDGMLWQNQGSKSQEALLLHIGRSNRKTPRVNLTDLAAAESHNSLHVMESESSFRINYHVAAKDNLSAASPFLALKASVGATPGFHKLKISGSPEIPRRVKLVTDHRLRGWAPYHTNEKICSAFEAKDPGNGSWIAKQGSLIAPVLRAAPLSESQLVYHRPMQSGESVAWEFKYKPAESLVHPSLGRLVFLLQPDGVQLHWLTDGEGEWTGLSADNAVADSAAQRSKQLPLKTDAWNKAELRLEGRTVQLRLNGILILERQHETQLETQFGFFHNRRAEAVSVRNVVLSGDWPATFAEAVNDDLLELRDADTSKKIQATADVVPVNKIERFGYQLARDAESLPSEERYTLLKNWVFPKDRGGAIRIAGGFVPSFFNTTLPGDQSNDATNSKRDPASLVSPALDLVAVAEQMRKLEELKEEIQASAKTSDQATRSSQLAILAAIATANSEFEVANKHLADLLMITQENLPSETWLWWPDLVAAWHAIQFPETIDNGIRILDHITVNRLNSDNTASARLSGCIRSMRGLANYRRNLAKQTSRPLPGKALWKPVTRVTAETSAAGLGEARWAMQKNGTVIHHSGHSEDYLYYSVPLRGDFVVTCELVPHGWQEARLMYADHWLGINYTGKQYEHGRAGFTERKVEFIKTPISLGQTYRHRMEVKDGTHSHWVNGTKIFEQKLTGLPDPWLAIRCEGAIENGPVHNLKITGSPIVPTELKLMQQSNLCGWTARHFGQTMRYSGGDWTRSGNYIIGARRTDEQLTMKESLLQYHRPMLEDGEFEYTFASSGSRMVHPALGRTAFILSREGVQEHTITNGIFGTEGLRPDNLQTIEINQVSTNLPLTTNNKLKVKLKGNRCTLVLNGIDIYRKTFDSQDQRFFGFFHYPGKTEARISDVIFRGNWPQSLPPASQQLLAGGLPPLSVDDSAPTQFLQHDFAAAGLPNAIFPQTSNPKIGEQITKGKDGAKMKLEVGDNWEATVLSPGLSIHGDFDIEAAFKDFSATTPTDGKAAGVQISVQLQNDSRDVVEVIRRVQSSGAAVLEAMRVVNSEDGTKYLSQHQPESATDGTLRIARRGETMFWMFAEADSGDFRIIREEAISDAPISAGDLDLKLVAAGGSQLSVVWKSLTIRAAKLVRE